MTIVIGEDGGIHMLADSDWPLESLVLHHGAGAAYRVTQEGNIVRVEAREPLPALYFRALSENL
jgi:hypothetical protein